MKDGRISEEEGWRKGGEKERNKETKKERERKGRRKEERRTEGRRKEGKPATLPSQELPWCSLLN